jgi:hypothetical protein
MPDYDALATEPRIPRYEEQPKPARKIQPSQFPNRLTVCFADDQVECLQKSKAIYRASESFMLRLAWDTFCRTNGLMPNNGGPNGR